MLVDKKYCCYCGHTIRHPLRLTSEHLVPLSKGGNNTIYNKRDCCHRCNNWRGNKSLEYWKSEIQELINRKQGNVPFYYVSDLEAIVINIEYIQNYIQTAGTKLYTSNEVVAKVLKVETPKPGCSHCCNAEACRIFGSCVRPMVNKHNTPDKAYSIFKKLKTDESVLFDIMNKIRKSLYKRRNHTNYRNRFKTKYS